MDTILEMAQHKIAGKAQKLIVAGCLVERYRNEIQKNIPEVDAVVGTGELQQILAAAGIAPAAERRWPLRHPEFALRRRCPRGRRTLLQRRLGRRHRRPAELSLRREHAAPAGHAEVHGLHQDRRRLRSSLLVLHHPAVARQVPLAPLRVRHRRGAAVGQAGCSRDHAHRAGHHLLRRRPRPERRPGAAAGAAGADRRAALGALPLRLSQQDHRQAAADHRRQRKDLLLHRRPAAACFARGAEEHEARRGRRHFPEVDREDAARDSRPDAAHVVHRRLPRRDAGGLRNPLRLRARSAVRLAGRLWLLRRRRRARPSPTTTRSLRARSSAAARS